MNDLPQAFSPPLLDALRRATHIVVLTGAGISAESGVPTFRQSATGLWARYDPMELVSTQAWRKDPVLVWNWHAWLRELSTSVEPNPAHFALARLEKLVPKLTLITQNIDGLHQRAGNSKVIELHGNIHRVRCAVEGTLYEAWDSGGEIPPRCPRCHGLLRPDVVWFGEMLPPAAWQEALQACRRCSLYFSIGTSSVVQPAASLSYEALSSGAVTIEVNPQETPFSAEAAYHLEGPAGRILPALLQAAFPA
jgi:NAD-dependent deacetylase